MDNKFVNMEGKDNSKIENNVENKQNISNVQNDVIGNKDDISDLTSKNVFDMNNISLINENQKHFEATYDNITINQNSNSPIKSNIEVNKKGNIEEDNDKVPKIKDEIHKEPKKEVMNFESSLNAQTKTNNFFLFII